MRKIIICLTLLLLTNVCFAQECDIIPKPKSVVYNEGVCSLVAPIVVECNSHELLPIVGYLSEYVATHSGDSSADLKLTIDTKLADEE